MFGTGRVAVVYLKVAESNGSGAGRNWQSMENGTLNNSNNRNREDMALEEFIDEPMQLLGKEKVKRCRL